MKKTDLEFIKNAYLKYIKKISEHHYQFKDGKIMLLIPYKEENIIIIKLKDDDSIYSIELEKFDHKRYAKNYIFIYTRNINPIHSIKRYKRHKDLISKTIEWLQDKEIDLKSYSDMRSKMSDLKFHLN